MLRAPLVVAMLASCSSSSSTSPPAPPASPAGEWRGTSLCTVKPSACHDETVVYRVSAAADRDGFVIVADKLVDGREEEMGTLTCHLDRDRRALTCPIDKGTFRYVLDGDHMHGTLHLTDGRQFRKIEIERVR